MQSQITIKRSKIFAPIESGMGVVSNALKGNIGGVISSLYGGAKRYMKLINKVRLQLENRWQNSRCRNHSTHTCRANWWRWV